MVLRDDRPRDGAPRDRLGALRAALEHTTIGVAMPAYREGAGISRALRSLAEALRPLGLAAAPVLVSDSGPERDTATAARDAAATLGLNLVIDHADKRRSLKQAVNVALDYAATDVLIVMVADVRITAESLVALLEPITCVDPPDLVFGSSLPEPGRHPWRQRAGAWQTRAVWRAMAALPPTTPRADGAFWAMRSSFYRSYRFPIGGGSIADDAELMRLLATEAWRWISAMDAIAYRVPPGSYHDFRTGLARSRVANPTHVRFSSEYGAALREAIHDPIGAALYFMWRARASLARGSDADEATELWSSQSTTKPSGDIR